MTRPSELPARRAWLRVLLATVAATLPSVLMVTPAAQAHTDLTFTQPYDGAKLERPPREIRLQFNEPVSAGFARITITVGEGRPARAATSVKERIVVATVPASLGAESDPGRQRWRVAYRVASQDGHPVTGTFSFSVTTASSSSPSASPTPAEPDEPGAEQEPGDASGVTAPSGASGDSSDAWRSTLSVGLVAAIGTGAALVWVARGRRRDRDT